MPTIVVLQSRIRSLLFDWAPIQGVETGLLPNQTIHDVDDSFAVNQQDLDESFETNPFSDNSSTAGHTVATTVSSSAPRMRYVDDSITRVTSPVQEELERQVFGEHSIQNFEEEIIDPFQSVPEVPHVSTDENENPQLIDDDNDDVIPELVLHNGVNSEEAVSTLVRRFAHLGDYNFTIVHTPGPVRTDTDRLFRQLLQEPLETVLPEEPDATTLMLFPQTNYYGSSGDSQVRAMQMLPEASSLAVTRNLPHGKLPIGKDSEEFSINTAIDSCAGVNLGDHDFHIAISKLYPESVAQLVNLEDAGNAVTIGGIEQNGTGVRITHVITYWLPSFHKGQQARVSFGLATNVAASALVGIGFLRATNSLLHFSGSEPELFVQAIDLNIPITFEAPSVRSPPARIDATSTYMASERDSDSSSDGEIALD